MLPSSLLLAWASTASATELVVAPFLQDAEPTSVWVVWEDDAETGAEVRVQPPTGAELAFPADSRATGAATWLHEAKLELLEPDTTYRYHVVSGDLVDSPRALHTPADDAAPRTLRLLAVSDMQQAAANPEVWGEVVEDGMIAWATEAVGGELAEAVAAMLIPGDLVDAGDRKEDWTDDFFGPAARLMGSVPTYPVLGNHENDSHWYYDYLHLPSDGPPGLEERVWSKRLATLELIGLDTNDPGTWPAQLAFLDERLDRACASEGVDFVLVQVHHPSRSELWRPGNNPLTGTLIARLEGFTERCGKPSLHLFGHTHAYSRGQTRDHAHLMVNVASAGGALDRWGEQSQEDVDAFTVSEDEWGFVVLELTTGEAGTLRLTRYDMGDEDTRRPRAALDEVLLRAGGGQPPATPEPLAPFGTSTATCVSFETSPYDEPEGDAHQATHWQVAASCDGFDDPELDLWRQDQNRYFGVDTRAGASLEREQVRTLDAGDWCWRVRHRDAALAWSGWSEPVPFTLTEATRTANLLASDEGETDDAVWRVSEGALELTGDRRCGARVPQEGAHALALGGLCTPKGASTVRAEVDLSDRAERIAQRGQVAYVSGWKAGAPLQVRLTQRDGDGVVLDDTDLEVEASSDWVEVQLEVELSAATRAVELRLRSEGTVEVDGFGLEVGDGTPVTCTPAYAQPPVDTGEPDDADDVPTCGCAAGGPPRGWLVLVALLGLARRRRTG